MGFIILLAIGGVMGWVASILARGDAGRTILAFVGTGSGGGLAAGALATRESLMVGLSALTLLAGFAGSLVCLVALTLARKRLAP